MDKRRILIDVFKAEGKEVDLHLIEKIAKIVDKKFKKRNDIKKVNEYLKRLHNNKNFKIGYDEGFIDGIRAYAWIKKGKGNKIEKLSNAIQNRKENFYYAYK